MLFSKIIPEIPENPQFKPQSIRLIDQVREALRYHRYAIRTEFDYENTPHQRLRSGSF